MAKEERRAQYDEDGDEAEALMEDEIAVTVPGGGARTVPMWMESRRSERGTKGQVGPPRPSSGCGLARNSLM